MKAKLLGKDLRSIAGANEIVKTINKQSEFDELFDLLLEDNRLLKMRTIDAIEKITLAHPDFLNPHKEQIIEFFKVATNKEFKWHIALLVVRMPLSDNEFCEIFNTLKEWALDTSESKIVRVNALQGLSDLADRKEEYRKVLLEVAGIIKKENIRKFQVQVSRLLKFTR